MIKIMRKYLFHIILVVLLTIVLSIFLLPRFTQPINGTEPEKSSMLETVQESEETPKPVIEDAITPAEQSEYIGKQPPDGYVEPKESDRYPHQIEYKDTYQSNIVVIQEEVWAMDFDNYNWYNYSPKPAHVYTGVHEFISYAILTYYDGKIPCNYFVALDDDFHNMHFDSTMIFEVQTHGEKPLNICLDTYNFKIRVEEGIKKKNLNCNYGCCD